MGATWAKAHPAALVLPEPASARPAGGPDPGGCASDPRALGLGHSSLSPASFPPASSLQAATCLVISAGPACCPRSPHCKRPPP